MRPVRAAAGVALLLVAAAGCSTGSTPHRSAAPPQTSSVFPEDVVVTEPTPTPSTAAVATTAAVPSAVPPTERVETAAPRRVKDQRQVTDQVRGFDGKVLPTHATVEDDRDDIVRNGEPDGKRRSGDLDLWSVSGAWVRTDLVLELRVKDLEPEHLRARTQDGRRYVASQVVASAQLPQGDSLVVSFGLDHRPSVSRRWPRALSGPGSDSARLDCPDRADPQRSRFKQAADYDRNTITFTLPIACLPPDSAQTRISGVTSWSVGKPAHQVLLSDSIQGAQARTQSAWFRFQ